MAEDSKVVSTLTNKTIESSLLGIFENMIKGDSNYGWITYKAELPGGETMELEFEIALVAVNGISITEDKGDE